MRLYTQRAAAAWSDRSRMCSVRLLDSGEIHNTLYNVVSTIILAFFTRMVMIVPSLIRDASVFLLNLMRK